MKKVLVPALAFLVFSIAANAQQNVPQKAVSSAVNKTVVHKPVGNMTNVAPKKTTSSGTVTMTKTTTKATAIKRKHPKAKKGKAKSKKM